MEYKSNILENLRPDYIQLGTALYLDKLTSNVSIGEIQGLTFTSRFMVKSTDSTANQIVLQHSGNGVAIAGIGQESSHGSLQLRLNSGSTQVRLSAIENNYIIPSLSIGATSTTHKLLVSSPDNNVLKLINTELNYNANQQSILFQGVWWNGDPGALTNIARIAGTHRSNGYHSGGLNFYSYNNGGEVNAISTRYDGNVGLGINDATAKLTLADHTTAAGGIKFRTASSAVSLYSASSGNLNSIGSINSNSRFRLPGGNAVADPDYGFTGATSGTGFSRAGQDITFVTGGAEQMRLDDDGNVGIGVTGPLGRLHVSDDDGPTSLYITNLDTAQTDAGDVQNTIIMKGLYWTGSATSQIVETRINSVHQLSNGNGGSALTFMTQTGGSGVVEQMRIDRDGAIRFNSYGAGTLVTDASGNITAAPAGPGNVGYLPLSAGSSYPLTGDLYLKTATNEGNLFFGTASASYKIFGGGTYGYMGYDTGGYHRFLTSGSERFRIASDGKIQVGSDKVIWAGGYGGALVIRQNNATSDRLIKMVTVDSTGAIAYDNVLVVKGANVGIGDTGPTVKLQVSTDSPSNNVAALIGDGWVGNSSYHKEGGLLLISGTSQDATQTGAGIAFQTRNTQNTNYWKSSMIMDRNGAIRFTLGGAGTVAGSEDFTILSGGNVGIGTTSPTFKLHVNSTDASDNVAYIHHDNAAQSSGDVLKVRSDAGDNAGSALLNVVNNTGSALYVRGDRKIGIGTDSPLVKLQVYGNPMPAAADAAGVEDMLTLYRNGSSTVWAGGASLSLGRYSAGGSSPKSRLDFKLKAAAGSNTALPELTVMTMNSDGRVGIGTIVPAVPLDVEGAIRSTNDNSGNHLELFCDGDNTGDSFIRNTGGRIVIESATDETSITTDNSGTGNAILEVLDSSSVAKIKLNSSGDSYLNGGDVGIGDTSPSNKLDVNGDIRATQYNLRGNVSNPTSTGVAIYDQATVGLTFSAHSTELRGWTGSAMARSAFITYNTATFTGTCTATNFILSSDETLKDNIKEIDTKHVDVKWKNFELISEPGVKRSGVIAQELEEKHPEFVRTDKDGLKSVAYIDLLISKIAELEARLEKAGI